jgi:tRNA(fMet)-specific endonuclease VapC
VSAVDEEDARTAGELRATLEGAGTPIGPYDLLVATQALRTGATLVTANIAGSPACRACNGRTGPQKP